MGNPWGKETHREVYERMIQDETGACMKPFILRFV